MSNGLKDSSRAILKAIAEGHSYDQILALGLAKSYLEIFGAAAAAIGMSDPVTPRETGSSNKEQLAKIREKYPKAFMKWTPEEENDLIHLFKSGKNVPEIAQAMQRKSGGIISRLIKLGLVNPTEAQTRIN